MIVLKGEAFSSGDVLLEIETDKAQMDVEAQDDGLLVKVMVGVKSPRHCLSDQQIASRRSQECSGWSANRRDSRAWG